MIMNFSGVRTLTLMLAASTAGCSSWALGDCTQTESRDLDLDAAGVRALAISARAGSLDIRGEPGLERVIVSGKACADDVETLAGIRLSERRNGDRLEVAAELPEPGSSWGWSSSPTLDLDIRVPSRLALEVTDSSGDTSIRDVSDNTVQDSSGDLRIANIAGTLSVNDSSGDIDIRDVAGDVRIPSDSSGDIGIENVEGNVLIDEDSSGSIEIRQVRGDADVKVDSSGDIGFVAVGGSARVGTDSSGDIDADDIGRDFIVGRDGSGGIRHDNVRGTVRIPED
jgi:hypothetical protein